MAPIGTYIIFCDLRISLNYGYPIIQFYWKYIHNSFMDIHKSNYGYPILARFYNILTSNYGYPKIGLYFRISIVRF